MKLSTSSEQPKWSLRVILQGMTSLSDILSGIKRLDSLKGGRKVSNILSDLKRLDDIKVGVKEMATVPGRDDIVKDIASLRNHIGKLDAKDRILLLGFHQMTWLTSQHWSVLEGLAT